MNRRFLDHRQTYTFAPISRRRCRVLRPSARARLVQFFLGASQAGGDVFRLGQDFQEGRRQRFR